MSRILTFLAVVSFATSAFGAITHGETLTYGSPSDLARLVDPPGEMVDVVRECGNITKADWNALQPWVIGFNSATGSGMITPSAIEAYYTDQYKVTFNNFTTPAGVPPNPGFDYNYGGYTSGNRRPVSGVNNWDFLGTVASVNGMIWFEGDVGTDEPGAYVSGIGFCIDPRDNENLPATKVYFTLSDGTSEYVQTPTLRDIVGPPFVNDALFIGYQTPAGLGITHIQALRDPGSGGSYCALDDLSFTVVPEPATMGLIVLGGLGLLARKRR